jgi:hypothetical protein
MSPFTVMPIQMFNWTSRPEAAFEVNAAAAGFVLVVMTLAMNGAGDLAALPPAQEHQVVSARPLENAHCPHRWSSHDP